MFSKVRGEEEEKAKEGVDKEDQDKKREGTNFEKKRKTTEMRLT